MGKLGSTTKVGSSIVPYKQTIRARTLMQNKTLKWPQCHNNPSPGWLHLIRRETEEFPWGPLAEVYRAVTLYFFVKLQPIYLEQRLSFCNWTPSKVNLTVSTLSHSVLTVSKHIDNHGPTAIWSQISKNGLRFFKIIGGQCSLLTLLENHWQCLLNIFNLLSFSRFPAQVV